MGCVARLKRRYELLHGLNHHVGIGLSRVAELEDGHNAVGARYLLEKLQLLLMLLVERQEVGDVLLETETQHEGHQQGGSQKTGHQTEPPPFPHHLVLSQDSVFHLLSTGLE